MNEATSIRDELAFSLFKRDSPAPGVFARAAWRLSGDTHNEYIDMADHILASPVIRRIQAKALREVVDVMQGEVAWTQNNFLRGPNADRYVSERQFAISELLEHAEAYEKGSSDV
ncbi:hypothetical protein [Microbacterium sp. LWH12-1.2]|uniref:hypothetical protein n=1 Tax=Microbacterium sp. LWH12-1.2 TaxID=3135259 RepID=UPI0034345BC2